MTVAQFRTLAALPSAEALEIATVTVHPHSGAATLENAKRRTLAILSPAGEYTYVAPGR